MVSEKQSRALIAEVLRLRDLGGLMSMSEESWPGRTSRSTDMYMRSLY